MSTAHQNDPNQGQHVENNENQGNAAKRRLIAGIILGAIGLGLLIWGVIYYFSSLSKSSKDDVVVIVKDSVKTQPIVVPPPANTGTVTTTTPGTVTPAPPAAVFTATSITLKSPTSTVKLNDSTIDVSSEIDGTWARMKAPITQTNNGDGTVSVVSGIH